MLSLGKPWANGDKLVTGGGAEVPADPSVRASCFEPPLRGAEGEPPPVFCPINSLTLVSSQKRGPTSGYGSSGPGLI